MVQVEGLGRQPPAQHDVRLTAGDLQTLIREAKRRCEFRSYGNRGDEWGRGHVDAIVIPNVGTVPRHASPIVAGLVGEYGTGWLIDRRCGTKCLLDLKLKTRGDGGKDLEANGMKFDVKTRLKDYGTFLVRKTDDAHRSVHHSCDAFVFATWGLGVCVAIHGWLPTRLLSDCRSAAAMRGPHINYEVEPRDLLPMAQLFDEVNSRKLWR